MLESDQAQAITAPRYRAVHTLSQMTTEPDGEWVHYDAHKAIVDSQAQRLADQAKTIEINAAYAIELQGKIAEHAKELAEAGAIADTHRDTVMMYKFGNQPQRDDFPDESRIRNPWEAHA